MNIGSKKAIFRACIILNIIFISFLTLTIILNYCLSDLIIEMTLIYYNKDISFQIYVLPAIYYLIYSIYFSVLVIYLNKKLKQTKQEFYNKILFLKIFSIILLILEPITAIFLIICAYKKDDQKEETPPYKHIKKNKENNTIKKEKPKINKDIKIEIKKLKSQKRKGIISEELYQKKLNKLLKNKVNN